MPKKIIKLSPSGPLLEVLTPSSANPPNPAKYLAETGEYTIPASESVVAPLDVVLLEGNKTGPIPIVFELNSYITDDGNDIAVYCTKNFIVSPTTIDDNQAKISFQTLGRNPIECIAGKGGNITNKTDDFLTGLPGDNSGNIEHVTGNVVADGVSGSILFRTGDNDNIVSGDINLATGAALGGGNSGNIGINSGNTDTGDSGALICVSGNSESGNSGPVQLLSGGVNGAGDSGNVYVQSGQTTTGKSGDLLIQAPIPSDGGIQGSMFLGGANVQIQVGAVTYTLPPVDGTAGQVLSTNGLGVLSWITP